MVDGLEEGDVLRESLNHFKRIRRMPETALEEISRDRKSFKDSTAGVVPSSSSARCPFAMAFKLADEFGFVLRLFAPSFPASSGMPLAAPFGPF